MHKAIILNSEPGSRSDQACWLARWGSLRFLGWELFDLELRSRLCFQVSPVRFLYSFGFQASPEPED